jgi:hypothetical protein
MQVQSKTVKYKPRIIVLVDKKDNTAISFVRNIDGYFTFIRHNEKQTKIYTTDSITGNIIDSLVSSRVFRSQNLFKFYVKDDYLYFKVLYGTEVIYNDKFYNIKYMKKMYNFDYLVSDKILAGYVKSKDCTEYCDTSVNQIVLNNRSINVYKILSYSSGGSEGKIYDMYKTIYYFKEDLIPIRIEYRRNSFGDIPYAIYEMN